MTKGVLDRTYKHPELREGEILLANATPNQFAASQYKTKRLGDRAYNVKGEPSTWPELPPVFVSRNEYNENVSAYGLPTIGDDEYSVFGMESV